MSETKQEEKIPTLKDFPVEWQIIVRAAQSLVSKARDGSDIEILRGRYSVIYNTKKVMLELIYYPDRKMLEILWEKYDISDKDERKPSFIKTIEKRMEEREALELISAWEEKITYHIRNKSSTILLLEDFSSLYSMLEELKKEREKKKERDEK